MSDLTPEQAELNVAREETARDCAEHFVAALVCLGDEEHSRIVGELAEHALEPGGPLDALTNAYDKALLLASGREAALRDVLAQTERERDEARRVLRFRELIDNNERRNKRNKHARETLSKLRAYSALLSDAGVAHGGSLYEVATALGLDLMQLGYVAHGRVPPFDDATTRRLCAFLGCDPAPLLEAAARAEEVLRG